MEAALAAPAGSGTVSSMIEDQAAIIGEKVELRRVAKIAGESFAVYLHKTSKDLPPQVGVVLAYSGSDADTARSVAQHISFADPQYLSKDDVPAEAVEAERRIVEDISRGEGSSQDCGGTSRRLLQAGRPAGAGLRTGQQNADQAGAGAGWPERQRLRSLPRRFLTASESLSGAGAQRATAPEAFPTPLR